MIFNFFKRKKIEKPKDAEYFQPNTGCYFKQKEHFLVVWDGYKWGPSGYRYASDDSFISLC